MSSCQGITYRSPRNATEQCTAGAWEPPAREGCRAGWAINRFSLRAWSPVAPSHSEVGQAPRRAYIQMHIYSSSHKTQRRAPALKQHTGETGGSLLPVASRCSTVSARTMQSSLRRHLQGSLKTGLAGRVGAALPGPLALADRGCSWSMSGRRSIAPGRRTLGGA